ncbi:MAG: adenosylhomocysteinase [Mageeibacillus sp.]|jgi:adenosylhomocysteinase|nr:adenosylhomocysteinase [Mageeibacillus sp.]MCI1263367.1 adenosylhomocysteinase [Saccharofermentans sp.]MCI1769033.1 adenosylhomocysteinase [Mageeibacillus sp.]MCI2043963.1 adenosylhomocysteinase [Mageeibacillus sp.]
MIMDIPEYDIKDIKLAPYGMEKIEWAYRNMPVLRAIERELIDEQPFKGLKISVSVHVEAKTACLARALARGGADVALTGCNPLSTQDDVAAALAESGMHVYTVHGDDEEHYINHLKMALSFGPDIVIDDGGDFAMLLHSDMNYLVPNILGGCEETTTGVHRLEILKKQNQLAYPVVAVNDARCKHLFDNRFGTGQSVWTAIMATTNLVVAGKTVVVAGFGMCGRGVAMRAKGLGAKVVVTEIDPVKACEAIMEGYDVMTMDQAAVVGDVFVTVTGCKDVIVGRHFNLMKDGAICCNAGHFDCEVNVAQLKGIAVDESELRKNVIGYKLSNGNTICILAEGRLVNLAAGDGHPVEIMDMSFALQAQSARYIASQPQKLPIDVYQTPEVIDNRVAEILLETKRISIDKLTDEQYRYVNSWDF